MKMMTRTSKVAQMEFAPEFKWRTLHFNQFHSEEQFDWLRFQNGWIKDFQVLRAMAHLLGNFHFHANFNIFKIQSEILRCFDFGLKACVCVLCVCHLYWDCKNQLLSTCKSLQALKWAWFFFHSISNICHVIDLLASIWLYWKFIEPIPCFSNGFKYILHTKKQSLAQLINDKCVHVHSQPEREGERKRTNKKTRGGNSMRKC